jgi:hypothetical protein
MSISVWQFRKRPTVIDCLATQVDLSAFMLNCGKITVKHSQAPLSTAQHLSILSQFSKIFSFLFLSFQTGCVYWPIAQLVNFFLIPPPFRALYVSSAAFVWSSIVCFIKAQPAQSEVREYMASWAPRVSHSASRTASMLLPHFCYL